MDQRGALSVFVLIGIAQCNSRLEIFAHCSNDIQNVELNISLILQEYCTQIKWSPLNFDFEELQHAQASHSPETPNPLSPKPSFNSLVHVKLFVARNDIAVMHYHQLIMNT